MRLSFGWQCCAPPFYFLHYFLLAKLVGYLATKSSQLNLVTAFLNARTLWFSWTFLAAILITAVVQRQLLQGKLLWLDSRWWTLRLHTTALHLWSVYNQLLLVTFQSPVSFVGFCLTLKRPAILLYVATHATACVVCHFSLKFLTCQSASSLSIVPRCQQVSEDLISGTSKSVEPKIEVI